MESIEVRSIVFLDAQLLSMKGSGEEAVSFAH